MRTFQLASCLVLLSLFAGTASAQFQGSSPAGENLGQTATQRWQIGFVFSAPAGPCRNITATQSVPMDWPEQSVTVAASTISPGVDVDYRLIGETVRRMVVTVPRLPAGATAEALVTFEIRRSEILEPEGPERFVLPGRTRMPESVRDCLKPSPYVESSHRTIRNLAAQIDPPDRPPWRRVEAIYDWVRENIRFVDDQGLDPVGTLTTLERKHGDCDEMSCLFLAICRASGIPARLVQVPGHVYAEFYLEDEKGNGRWFPCQLAGTRAFGHMPEHRPVLQKGDNLTSPHVGRKKYLILPQHVTAASGVPTVQIVVRQVAGD